MLPRDMGLTGTIPPELSGLSASLMCLEFCPTGCPGIGSISGSPPAELTSLTALTRLDLDTNSISGSMGRLITVDIALPIAAWFARMSHCGAVFAMMMMFLAVGSASEHGNELAVATEVSHLLMNAPTPLTQSLTFTLTPLIQSYLRSVLTAPSRMAALSWTAMDIAVQATQRIIGAVSTVAGAPTKGWSRMLRVACAVLMLILLV